MSKSSNVKDGPVDQDKYALQQEGIPNPSALGTNDWPIDVKDAQEEVEPADTRPIDYKDPVSEDLYSLPALTHKSKDDVLANCLGQFQGEDCIPRVRLVYAIANGVSRLLHEKKVFILLSRECVILEGTKFKDFTSRGKPQAEHYKSPELRKHEAEPFGPRHQHETAASLVYSLAVLSFEIITCTKFETLTPQEVKDIMSDKGEVTTKYPSLYSTCTEDLRLAILNGMLHNAPKRVSLQDFLGAAKSAAALCAHQSSLFIDEKNIVFPEKKGAVAMAEPSGYFKRYSATLKLPSPSRSDQKVDTPVVVDIYYPAAWTEYIKMRDIMSITHLKPGLSKYIVPYYGCNNRLRWIVTHRMDGSLSQVYVDARNSKRELISDLAKAWILFDIARGVDALHKPAPPNSMTGHIEAVVMHRDIKSDNIMLIPGWEHKVAELKTCTDMEKLPVIAYLGNFGTANTTSCSGHNANNVGDQNYWPPDVLTGIYKYGPSYDIWRFGLVVFELYCGVCLTEGTQQDRCRMTQHRLMPYYEFNYNLSEEARMKARPPLAKAFSEKWMAYNGVPPLIYEFTQLGCWQIKPEYRPTAASLREIAKWHLEDTMIAKNIMKPRAAGAAVKPGDYCEYVFKMCGFRVSEIPPTPKKGACFCPVPNS